MPTISISRDYSTSKNLKMYLIQCMDGGLDGSSIKLTDGFVPYEFQKDGGGGTLHPFYLINYVPNLQEIPDLTAGEGSGSSTDTIEITTLADAYHEYADGLKNRGDSEGDSTLSFTFLYDKDCYWGLQEAMALHQDVKDTVGASGKISKVINDYSFVAIVLPDDSYFYVPYKDISTIFRGVGVNSALTYQLDITLNGSVKWKNGWSDLGFASKAGKLIYKSGSTHYENFAYMSRGSESTAWTKQQDF